MIPAGDWTLDIGGVVNAYYTNTRASGDIVALSATERGDKSVNNITTGLLPNYLSVSGKTRQNDLDVGFTISINPGASTTSAGMQGFGSTTAAGIGSRYIVNQENRQAFLTFGDASWGSIKVGKDLGIYASDAILNDMTLLGVGSGAGLLAGNTTTLGRIGTGFMYADWKSQIAYSSPNFNGFSFTVGVTQGWNAIGSATAAPITSAGSTGRSGSQSAYEGKASYEWTGDVAGKVWASAISQKVEGLNFGARSAGFDADGAIQSADAGTNFSSERANAWDIGTTVNVAGLGLTGYYGQGKGIGQTVQLSDGFDQYGKRRDSDQWYVQATYALPTATKIGMSYGESTLDGNSGEDFREQKDSMWTVGAYHPITKHLNLVAEYSVVESENKNAETGKLDGKTKTVSLGAILFF